MMKPKVTRILCGLLGLITISNSGCRAIRHFGEGRQSIAARRLSGQGFQAMHDGQWEIAETLFTDALEVSTADDRAHWGLAESYWKRQETELAIEQMEQAVRLSAGDPKMVQRLGHMYLQIGRLQEAESHSLWALETERDSAQAWALRGNYLKAAGKDDEALAAYHRALALQPDYPQVQLQAAEIYHLNLEYDRLLATLDRLQDSVGTDAAPARVDVLRGIAMRNHERFEEARRCFARASIKPDADATAHLELASLEMQTGNIPQARASLEVAHQIDPDLVRDGRWMEQLDDHEQRLAKEPTETPGVPQRR
ncbi:MAG: tetratricopeptide repeat protein [Rubripirellula sp.]